MVNSVKFRNSSTKREQIFKGRKPKIVTSFDPIEREIIKYLSSRPLKDCTISKMAKKGGIREKVGISWGFLKKKIMRLMEKRKVYEIKVVDPISKRLVSYYTLLPNCPEVGEAGIPKYIHRNQSYFLKFLQEYYWNLSLKYSIMEMNFCKLCKKWSRVFNIKKEMGCGRFFDLFRAFRRNDYSSFEDSELVTNEKRKRDLKRCFKEWEESVEETLLPFVLFLEDWISAILTYILFYAVLPACEECKHKEKCHRDGIKWIKRVLEPKIYELPENGLKRFWENIVKGKPEIDIKSLNKYFSERWGTTGKQHTPFLWLKIYEEYLPYFYAKLLPLSLSCLVLDTLFPLIKRYNEWIRKSELIKMLK